MEPSPHVDLCGEATSFLTTLWSTPTTVLRARRSVGGLSRETWFIDVARDDSADPLSLTLRIDPPHGAVAPTPLLLEYDVLRALEITTVPVPRTVGFVHSADAFGGRAAYVRHNVAGSASPAGLMGPGAEQDRRAIGADYPAKLAAIHTLDWQAAGFTDFMTVPDGAAACALDDLARWRRHYESYGSPADPEMSELFAWLRDNAPATVPSTSLVWGDAGLGNFVYRDGSIVALLDWEQSHLGDPTKDVAASLWRGAGALLGQEEFLRRYTERSGITVDPRVLLYYEIYIAVTYSASCRAALGHLDAGDPAAVPVLRLGLGTPVDCHQRAFAAIERWEREFG